jgi:hypothetical protein
LRWRSRRKADHRDPLGRHAAANQGTHLIGHLGRVQHPVGAPWSSLGDHHESPFGKDLENLLVFVDPEFRVRWPHTGTLDDRPVEVEEVAGVGTDGLRHFGNDLTGGFNR